MEPQICTKSRGDRPWRGICNVLLPRGGCSNSAHSAPQSGDRSGVDRSQERSTEVAQVPGDSTVTWISAATDLQPTVPVNPIPQPSIRSRTDRERDATLSCFWVKLQACAWKVHRFTGTTQASLASVITSFEGGHTLKGNEPD